MFCFSILSSTLKSKQAFRCEKPRCNDGRSYVDALGVSKNSGTPKSSILIGFSIINHPFWGTPIFGNTLMIHCNHLQQSLNANSGTPLWVGTGPAMEKTLRFPSGWPSRIHCAMPQGESYCWWLKSCTTKDDDYPIIHRVSYIPGGAGFQPSTVSLHRTKQVSTRRDMKLTCLRFWRP